ncbi:MAG: SDR family oxidoreductase [Steroidobacteraceae bacterium]|nr:SDR family oxidoreductase [Steroidobacteraceae bacterium]
MTDHRAPTHDGKVVVIVGGTGAIGGAVGVALGAAGAKVVLAGRNEQAAARNLDAIRGGGADALFVPADVTRSSDLERLVAETVARFGRLDCAFNNAGWEGTEADTANIDESDWSRMLDVKLSGVWRGMKYQLRQMLVQGGGSIVNMAGSWGLAPAPRYGAYCAAAHGIVGLTRTAALEYAGKGIRVNAVCPGAVDTPMLDRMFHGDGAAKAGYGASIPMGRLARPDDIAGAVLWLTSDAAGYVTGQAIGLTGGS